MPRDFTRAERVSDAVQQELAVLIRDEVRDPRVGMVSVTDVDVSRDLAYAKIHVTFVGDRDQEEIDQAVRALNGAAGYFARPYCSHEVTAVTAACLLVRKEKFEAISEMLGEN